MRTGKGEGGTRRVRLLCFEDLDEYAVGAEVSAQPGELGIEKGAKDGELDAQPKECDVEETRREDTFDERALSSENERVKYGELSIGS